MALITKGYTFSAGSTVIASEHNSNYDTIYNDYNGNIENANIKAATGIAGSKISPAFTTNVTVAGNLSLTSVGNKLLIKEGVNASMGTATLTAGVCTGVSNTLISVNSKVFFTVVAVGGTVGTHYISAVTSGSVFNINSTNANDTSRIGYLIIEPV